MLIGGEIAIGRAHHDRALALYDPTAHRVLATRFAVDLRVAILCHRSLALWLLGYPEAALADADRTGGLQWKGLGRSLLGCVLTLRGGAAEGIDAIRSGLADYRATGTTLWLPMIFSYLAGAHADLGQFDEAWHWIGEAMVRVESTQEKWAEAELHRVAGEIALRSPVPDAARAVSYFTAALAISRRQQAKSWELRTATSYARLLRDQGRVREAHDLLAPVYGWFTEGFATKDLNDAQALLDELVERALSGTAADAAAMPGGPSG